MDFEKIKEIRERFINNKSKNYADVLYEDVLTLNEDEQNLLFGSLAHTEYDYEEDETLDETKNELFLTILRDKRFKVYNQRLLDIISEGSEKSREYWRNLGILIGDEFRWISKYEN
jgi:hypothetical protein